MTETNSPSVKTPSRDRSGQPAFLELNILPERYRRRRITFRLLAPWLSLLILAALLFPNLQRSRQVRQSLLALESRYGRLQAELASYTPLIEEVEALEDGIARAEARAQAFESVYQNVQIQTVLWNERFSEMLQAQPEGLSITSIRLDEAGVTLEGFTQSYQQPLELVRRLGAHTSYQRMYVEEIANIGPAPPEGAIETEGDQPLEVEETPEEAPLPPFAFQIRLPLLVEEPAP